MKQLLGVVLGITICAVACKKKDSGGDTLPENSWRFNDTLYHITKTAYSKTSDTANYFNVESSSPGFRYGKLTFSFRSYPTAGSYKIASSMPTDDQSVLINIQIGSAYYTATSDGAQLGVNISGGYVQLVGNGIVVQNNNNASDQTYIAVNAFF
ncbi:hypothetical protein [Taibaiella soli]|uniref:Uncharacterized protein n=1 Tax=Taibaiella soli TaxID=1649169 RepID=A0A2W2AT26_9BACT|nr:hypothetical protein [Taibaiella soli]PZF71114.1 hypothetical protein DN068_20675 [Taibaiella soli]